MGTIKRQLEEIQDLILLGNANGGNGMKTYNVQTDTYAFRFRADLSQASAPIELLDDDGEWQPTQWQTASVGHCEWEAARQLADDIDSAGGGDPSTVISVG